MKYTAHKCTSYVSDLMRKTRSRKGTKGRKRKTNIDRKIIKIYCIDKKDENNIITGKKRVTMLLRFKLRRAKIILKKNT